MTLPRRKAKGALTRMYQVRLPRPLSGEPQGSFRLSLFPLDCALCVAK